jgi:adenylyltransferase/sulfurtransferase
METCDSAGVLGPAIGIIASWQSAEALKILSGNAASVCQGLLVIDCWNSDCRIVQLRPAKACPACAARQFPFLSGEIRTEVKILCGKNAVQLESPVGQHQSLDRLAASLRNLGQVQQNAFFVRVALPEHTLTIFRGGRAVVEGTQSEAEAKSVLARSLGS